MSHVLYIKNMVCNRCIKVVTEELTKLDLDIKKIELGKVVLKSNITEDKLEKLEKILKQNGFELIDDKKAKIVNEIKTLIIKIIHYNENIKEPINNSEFISQSIGYDYSYLSTLFSSVEGITIEKYIILQKIEKVKELLQYNELSLSEISYLLGYSSVQHLSNQFKKVTGMSPSQFKRLHINKRKPLDKI